MFVDKTVMSLVRHLDFLKENIIIMVKLLTEFKASFYSVIFEQFFFTIINVFMFSVLFTNFGEVIGWSFTDFILFLILFDFFEVFIGIFFWNDWLKIEIINGSFNLRNTKPMNVYWNTYFSKLSHYALLYTVLTFFIYSFFILYFSIELFNIFLGIGVFLLIGIFWISFSEFIRSLDWFFLGLSQIVWQPLNRLNYGFRTFPSPFFKSFNFKFLFFFFPVYLLGDVLLPILKGEEVLNLMSYIWFLVIGIVVLITCTSVAWRYGLSKYEAYG